MRNEREVIDAVADIMEAFGELAQRVPSGKFPSLVAEVVRFLRSLTPEQVADLSAGRASLAVVVPTATGEPWEVTSDDGTVFENWGVRQEIMRARRNACTCPCDHDGGCLTCGCRCEPTDPAGNVCPCCKADDGDLITAGGTA